MGILPQELISNISKLGKFMIVMALSAVGLNADFKKMLKSGLNPIILGCIVWISVASSSLAVQYFTKQL